MKQQDPGKGGERERIATKNSENRNIRENMHIVHRYTNTYSFIIQELTIRIGRGKCESSS